jgi:hypothetical protein
MPHHLSDSEVIFLAEPAGKIFRALAFLLRGGNEVGINSGIGGIDAKEAQQGGINAVPVAFTKRLGVKTRRGYRLQPSLMT